MIETLSLKLLRFVGIMIGLWPLKPRDMIVVLTQLAVLLLVIF